MQSFGLFLLRVIPAALMLGAHGWSKLMSFTDRMDTFPDPLGVGSPTSLALAIFAEVVCAALLLLGVATRLVAVPLLITMLVAAFVIHAQDPFPKQEFPLLYAVIFLVLMFTGGGSYGFGNRFKSKWLKT